MATKPAANPAEARPVQKSKLMLFVLIGVVVLFVLGAAGAWFFMSKKHHDADEEDEAGAEPTAMKVDPSQPPVFIPIEPFTVNLQPDEGGEQYLQVVLNFRAADAKLGEQLKLYMPEVRHHILMLLSSKKASEINSVGGREALATQICTESNKVLNSDLAPKKRAPSGCGGPIVAVLFTSFIVQ